jgi:hypothetical protein
VEEKQIKKPKNLFPDFLFSCFSSPRRPPKKIRKKMEIVA